MKKYEFKLKYVKFDESILISIFYGGIAGCIAKSVIAPLDRAKINFQATENKFTFKAVYKFLMGTYKNNGVRYLWRGNSATMTRVFPYAGIQYTANEIYKGFFNISSHNEIPLHKYSMNNRKMVLNFLSGALAGITSVTITYPLDLARARMAVTHSNKYRNLFHLIGSMAKEEGLLSIYKGITPTVIGIVPYSGIGFLVFETIKDRLTMHEMKLSTSQSLVSGACAGIIAQFTCYPLDIIRRRMQTSSVTGQTDYSKHGIIASFYLIKKGEGISRGLFKGFSMNLIKTPTVAAISFTVYHKLCDMTGLKVGKPSTSN